MGRLTETDWQLSASAEFGGVSIGDETASIGIKIDRGDISLDEADELFADKRLEGVLRLSHSPQLPTMEDEPLTIESTFDIKGFRVKAKHVSARCTFALDSIDVATLSHFAKQRGTVSLNHVADLDDEDQAENDSAFDEAADDDAPGQQRMFGTEETQRRKRNAAAAANGDASGAMDLAELGFSKARLGKLYEAGLKTVGDLERFIASDEWWHRKIKGVGEKAVNEISDALVAFRQRHPVPASDSE